VPTSIRGRINPAGTMAVVDPFAGDLTWLVHLGL